MNIFILDNDPAIAAKLQCDKHVVKMIVESAQMLSTAHRMLDGDQELRPSKSGKRMVKYWVLPDSREEIIYKAVHMGHPCTVWTMKNDNNYNWHYNHFVALCREYTYRYGKVHATEKLLKEPLSKPPKNIKSGYKYLMSPFALAMQHEPQCINESDAVKSYQDYYNTKQKNFKMVWTKRQIPEWFKENINE
jgi:hypothetical protein|tara:strand:+ start:3910 stop:4482 length:573 start_codon:yes stop_codon:yes gene_type:complete